MELTAQGDFGPHTQVKLTEWIENIPVKDELGNVVGRAKMSDTGMIHAVIDEALLTKEMFDKLRMGFSDSISIEPINLPAEPAVPLVKYSEEVRQRFNQERHHP